MGGIIKCIYVEKNGKNGDAINEMIGKISMLKLLRSYKSLETASKACLKGNYDILFVHLNKYPVAKKDLAMLQKIMNHGTRIIVISHRVSIAKNVLTANINNFVSIPTSARRLWKACMNALNVIDYGIKMPEENSEDEKQRSIFEMS